MTWYQNPTVSAVLGAVAGAIISAIVSVIIWRKTLKIKRIDCIINDISSLLSVSDKIKDELDVSYSEKKVESVYFISLEIINSGNEAVKDQPVNIRLANKSNIIDYSSKTFPAVGFGDIEEHNKKDNSLELKIALMNPGDKVSLEIVSIDNSDETVDVFLKNENVHNRIYSNKHGDLSLPHLTSEKNMMLLAIISSLPLVGGFARSLINVGLVQSIGKLKK